MIPGEADRFIQREVDFWRSTQANSLAQDLVEHHVRGHGGEKCLSEGEMRALSPMLNLMAARIGVTDAENGFPALVMQCRSTGSGKERVEDFAVLQGAPAPGTLARFYAHYTGTLEADEDGSWRFHGTVRFEDSYDFDVGPRDIWQLATNRGRRRTGELKNLVGCIFVPGRRFRITSVEAPYEQSYDAQTGTMATRFSGVPLQEGLGVAPPDLTAKLGIRYIIHRDF